MKLFKRSWHLQLATTYGKLTRWETDHEVNFCKYLRECLNGSIMVSFIMFVSGAVAVLLGDLFAWIAAQISMGAWIVPSEAAGIAMIFIVSISATVGVILLQEHVLEPMLEKAKYKRYLNESKEKKFSFFGTWYRSVKDKVCFSITVPGRDKE